MIKDFTINNNEIQKQGCPINGTGHAGVMVFNNLEYTCTLYDCTYIIIMAEYLPGLMWNFQ